MRIGRYILVDGVVVAEPDLMKWASWMDGAKTSGERFIQKTKIDDEISVSTVFLGLDHSFDMDGPPEVFETMIFGGPYNESMWRYATKAEALEGHKVAVTKAREGELGPRDWSPRKGTCFCKRPHDGYH